MTDKKIVVVGGRASGKTAMLLKEFENQGIVIARSTIDEPVFDQVDVYPMSVPCEHFSTRETPGGDVAVAKNVRLSFPTFFLTGSPPSYPKDLADRRFMPIDGFFLAEATMTKDIQGTFQRWANSIFYRSICSKRKLTKRAKRRGRHNAK